MPMPSNPPTQLRQMPLMTCCLRSQKKDGIRRYPEYRKTPINPNKPQINPKPKKAAVLLRPKVAKNRRFTKESAVFLALEKTICRLKLLSENRFQRFLRFGMIIFIVQTISPAVFAIILAKTYLLLPVPSCSMAMSANSRNLSWRIFLSGR